MLEALWAGLFHVLAWPTIGYLVLGVLLGLYFGAVPGLSGLVGMAILLPFTYQVDPVGSFALLLGMTAVTTTSDTIASILLGVPGTAASQATILDGYPMAQKGEAVRAFGAAFTVSAIGGLIGGLFLALSIPIVRPLILSFASPEFFLLGLLGLTMVGSLSGDSLTRGLAAATMGLLLSTIGLSPQTGLPRYDLGIIYLLEGFSIIPVVLGLFAIPELIFLAIGNTSIANVPESKDGSSILQGMRDAMRHWWLTLRCSVLGTYIGMLPGLGASIVDWAAYGHAVQSARDSSQFGKGDVRGVIAPEAANNASKGGALIPTVVFGIPGSSTMAILLGAFLIHGLTPGPEMLSRNLDITFSLVWMLCIANVLGAILLMLWARQLAKLTFVRGKLIIPGILLFVLMGAWMSNNTMGDWYVLFGFGLVGLFMRLAGWPRAPLILGFILGPIMENALFITLQRYTFDWVLRPISAILIVFIVLTIVLTMMQYVRRRRRIRRGEQKAVHVDLSGDASGIRPASLPLAVFSLALAAWATWSVSNLSYEAALFPLTATIPALLLFILIIGQEFAGFRRQAAASGTSAAGHINAAAKPTARSREMVLMHFWFAGIIAATWIAGQLVALPLFSLAYLILVARVSWLYAGIYSATAFFVLYIMFDKIINVIWFPSLLLN
jgi:putative tricarboxylic transport membrane protein